MTTKIQSLQNEIIENIRVQSKSHMKQIFLGDAKAKFYFKVSEEVLREAIENTMQSQKQEDKKKFLELLDNYIYDLDTSSEIINANLLDMTIKKVKKELKSQVEKW